MFLQMLNIEWDQIDPKDNRRARWLWWKSEIYRSLSTRLKKQGNAQIKPFSLPFNTAW